MQGLSKHNEIDEKIHKGILSTSEVLLTPRASQMLAYWLLGFLALFFITLWLPWQQNIQAEGGVTALAPQDRPQTIESAIAGRIKKWHVREGQKVKKGDTILELSEIKDKFFDPELLLRISEQVEGKQLSIEGYKGTIQALEAQIEALQQAMTLSIEKQENKVKQTRLKIVSDSADVEAEKVNIAVARRQADDGQRMFDKGLIALVTLESRKMKMQEASYKLISSQNKLDQSRQELANALIELNSLRAEYADKISKARSDLNKTRASLGEGQSELSKITNEYANMKIRNEQYVLRAPQDGMVVKALKAGIGETIKEQEAVATIMPDNPMVAVELYVKPMDVPLLSIGRHVRLEFDGWPALQFSGWPNVAVGTFGGRIAVIDAVDSKEGKYRVLVSPDPNDTPWPAQLRQGSGVFGWAMLDDVPIYYEIWRQLNGFPPSLREAPEAKEGEKKS